MGAKSQNREDKIKLLNDLRSGKVSVEQLQKIVSGKKVVLRTFLDHLKFFYCQDEHGNPVNRSAQIRDGEIEVEMPDSVFNNALRELLKQNKLGEPTS